MGKVIDIIGKKFGKLTVLDIRPFVNFPICLYLSCFLQGINYY